MILNTNTTPLVSVCCITYNHENFIRDTIEGVMMQKTDFSFEVIIHDDASTDNTADIIREYEVKYPNIIKPIYQTENQYSKVKNILLPILPLCRGKYIALCEGDDYWTDKNKLQKQVDFLEANEDYAICFHNIKVLKNNELIEDKIQREVPETSDIYELAKGNFINTAACVFRRNEKVLNSLINLKYMPAADFALHLLNAQYGKIKKLPDVMSVYRAEVGIWSKLNYSNRINKTLTVLDVLIDYFTDSKLLQVLINTKYTLLQNLILYGNISDDDCKKLLSANPYLSAFKRLADENRKLKNMPINPYVFIKIFNKLKKLLKI